jgi:hypothetical protein
MWYRYSQGDKDNGIFSGSFSNLNGPVAACWNCAIILKLFNRGGDGLRQQVKVHTLLERLGEVFESLLLRVTQVLSGDLGRSGGSKMICRAPNQRHPINDPHNTGRHGLPIDDLAFLEHDFGRASVHPVLLGRAHTTYLLAAISPIPNNLAGLPRGERTILRRALCSFTVRSNVLQVRPVAVLLD